MSEARQKESVECGDMMGRARGRGEREREMGRDRKTRRTTKEEGRSEKGPAQVMDAIATPGGLDAEV